jgi:hypothetical protein
LVGYWDSFSLHGFVRSNAVTHAFGEEGA